MEIEGLRSLFQFGNTRVLEAADDCKFSHICLCDMYFFGVISEHFRPFPLLNFGLDHFASQPFNCYAAMFVKT